MFKTSYKIFESDGNTYENSNATPYTCWHDMTPKKQQHLFINTLKTQNFAL